MLLFFFKLSESTFYKEIANYFSSKKYRVKTIRLAVLRGIP